MKNPEIFNQIDEENIIRDNPHEFVMENGAEIINLLESAEIKTLGNIDELDTKIQPHSNKVFLTELDVGENLRKNIFNSNAVRFFELNYGEGKLVAVFKPKSGEDTSRIRTFDIDPHSGLYTRERAAYLVDQHANLGIVCPTVIRKIDNEIGSLQLYIPHAIADEPRRFQDELDREKLEGGNHWKKMAMLDRLIDNADRSDENFLVCKNDHSQIFAIDHGLSFCLVPDPTKETNRAYQYFAKNRELAFLDDELRTCLEKLLSHEDEIESELADQEDISNNPELIAKGLLTTRVFERARRMTKENSILI